METFSSSSASTETDQWLNLFQMKQKLGMQHLPDDDELLLSELERYEQHTHPAPAWAAKGMKEYKYIEKKSQKGENHTHDHTMAKQLDASKAKVLKDENSDQPEVTVDWKKCVKGLCKNIKTQMEKAQKAMGGSKKVRSKIKKLDKLKDLGEKMSNGENGFNERLDQWVDRFGSLEDLPPTEETHKDMKALLDEMKDTTTVFESSVEAAAQAAVEVEKEENA